MNQYLSISKMPFNNIVIGLLFMMMGTLGRQVFKTDIILMVLGIFSWYFLIRGYLKMRLSLRANSLANSYRILLVVYLSICAIMIVRGYTIDYRYQWSGFLSALRFHFFDQLYILPYLMPIVVFIPYRYYRFDIIIRWSVILAIGSIVLLLMFFSEIVMHAALKTRGLESDNLMSGTEIVLYGKLAFVSLCSHYITSKQWYINIVGLIVVALILLIAARRGASVTYILLMIFSLYMYSKRRGFITTFFIVTFLFIAGYFIMTSSWLDYLYARGMEDTRSGVEEAMLNQMTDIDKIFGLGLNGRYYYPLRVDEYLEGWRYGIETGFLNLVLKGGYLMAFTYIILLAIPAYKGLFKSKNQLCRAGGFYIMVSLFELYPFGWLTFDLKFLIIWMMVVLCMNPTIRMKSDVEIKKMFF